MPPDTLKRWGDERLGWFGACQRERVAADNDSDLWNVFICRRSRAKTLDINVEEERRWENSNADGITLWKMRIRMDWAHEHV